MLQNMSNDLSGDNTNEEKSELRMIGANTRTLDCLNRETTEYFLNTRNIDIMLLNECCMRKSKKRFKG